MSDRSHRQRIIDLLLQRSGLDDDEIAQALGIMPRQTVNQICSALARHGFIRRERGARGKIVNRVIGRQSLEARLATAQRPAPRPEGGDRSFAHAVVPSDLSASLIVIPCSGRKREAPAIAARAPDLLGVLPEALAHELRTARCVAAGKACLDERRLMPARERYDGYLYRQGGRDAISRLVGAGAKLLIVSGGYGAVLADEPIGLYDAALKLSWWPHRLLDRVLLAYAAQSAVRSVRAFAAATSAYYTLLNRINWRKAGIHDAMLIAPEIVSSRRKGPETIGEALRALADGSLSLSWRSSHGLSLLISDYAGSRTASARS